MDRAALNYELPRELIAQAPLAQRSASRLLMLNGRTGDLADSRFAEIVDWFEPGDLLVVNDTRVLPARLRGQKTSGGSVEMLLERLLGECEGRFQLRASRSPHPGTKIVLPGNATAEVTQRHGDLFDLVFDRNLADYVETHGTVPLPPYIERSPNATDVERYQTIFASRPGAVAAPTAGLHFTEEILEALSNGRVAIGHVTLHVGAGTFQPVRAERIEDHRLHPERVEVSDSLCRKIAETRGRGGRVVAVGTTTVRALETLARNGMQAFADDTELFIYPGFEFRLVDAMVTNFHLPESSLLALVAAFAGYDHVMRAYRHAVAQRYRFFSYGDAMLITGRTAS